MKTQKKSQITVQFNWIFILIAGGLILTFFFMIANKQKESSSIAISAKVKENVDAIIGSAKVSSGTSTQIQTSPLEMRFSCEDSGYSTYRVGGLSTQTPADVIFAPERLSGRDLVTWAYSWDQPFKIMNFLYIANPRTRFVVIGDKSDNLYSMINDTFPKDFMVDFYPDLSSVESNNQINLNDDTTRFIFVNKDPGSHLDTIFDNFPDRENKVTVLHISGDNLNFYEEGSDQPETSRSGSKASLFGAIFSGSKEFYDCNMKKALRRFNFVNEIYWQRSTEMQDHYFGDNAPCSSVYSNAVNAFSGMNDSSFKVFDSSSGSVANIIEDLQSQEYGLSEANDMAKRQSCDLIY